jgi:hypothetical protein
VIKDAENLPIPRDVNIDREHLGHDLQLVGAALGPLGLLLGIAGHDMVTVVVAAAIGIFCALRLTRASRSDRARLAVTGLAAYAGGAVAIVLAAVFGQLVAAAPAFAMAEAGVAVLSLPALFLQAAAGSAYANR